MAKQSTAEFYKKNPKAKAKRNKQQRAYMQTEKGKEIRRNADNLRNGLKAEGIKQPPNTEAGHNPKGKSVNGQKGGWQNIKQNRRSRLKVRKA